MKPLYLLAVICLSAFLLSGCKHEMPKPLRLVDKMSGVRIWHGFQSITNYTTGQVYHDTFFNLTDTVFIINDSQIKLGSPFVSLSLTYIRTDSVRGYALFQFILAPPSLYYYYTRDSMHYSDYEGGIHDMDLELYTP